MIFEAGTLRIGAEDGLALITDLQSSQGLSPLPGDPASDADGERLQVFQVKPVGPAPSYEGFLSEDRTEATIDAALELAVVDHALRITADWLVTPRGNLRGRLPISLPRLNLHSQNQPSKAEGAAAGSEATAGSGASPSGGPANGSPDGDSAGSGSAGSGSADGGSGEAADSEPDAAAEASAAEQWEATVDGRPGLLRPDAQGRIILYSDDLDNLPRRVRLTALVPLPEPSTPESALPAGAEPPLEEFDARFRELTFTPPRPALVGGTLNGPLEVRPLESPGYELRVEQESEPVARSGEASPRLTVAVRVRPPEIHRRQIITRAVLHSEINRTRRYDRLLAQIVGAGDSFQIAFAPNDADDLQSSEAMVRVYVDGQETLDFVETRQGISVALDPADSHLVDLRLWRSHSGGLLAGVVRPAWELPVGSGNIYWDVMLATDRHLIWTAPGTTELMHWRYAKLFVRRVATQSYADLLRWIGAPERPELQVGNRYLLVTSDPGSLRFFEAGRPLHLPAPA